MNKMIIAASLIASLSMQLHGKIAVSNKTEKTVYYTINGNWSKTNYIRPSDALTLSKGTWGFYMDKGNTITLNVTDQDKDITYTLTKEVHGGISPTIVLIITPQPQ